MSSANVVSYRRSGGAEKAVVILQKTPFDKEALGLGSLYGFYSANNTGVDRLSLSLVVSNSIYGQYRCCIDSASGAELGTERNKVHPSK